MSERALRIHATWDRAEGVSTPELAATWSDLAVEVGEDVVTLVKDRRSDSIRPSVHTSAYPLALWIAQHWWALTEHVRASATDTGALRWTARVRPSWLSSHNVRGAGDGMPWPDLAILPEGGIARLVWFKGAGVAGQPITFLTSGNAFVPMGDLRAGLTELVESVLERLDSSGVPGTTLHDEWNSLAELTTDERQFAQACGRLGLDPFSLSDSLADEIEQLEHRVPSELLDDFLATADPHGLQQAAAWVEAARSRLHAAKPVALDLGRQPIDDRRPWLTGYAAARDVRRHLGLGPTETIELDDFVGLDRLDQPAEGLRGLAGRVDGGVGLVVPGRHGGTTATRFSQAWALGLTTLAGRHLALLDPSQRAVPRASRAFAAELLAPAEGVERLLEDEPEPGERAFELIADRFGASPTLVAHQYQNQILASPL